MATKSLSPMPLGATDTLTAMVILLEGHEALVMYCVMRNVMRYACWSRQGNARFWRVRCEAQAKSIS
jgi:hypothetical protein